MEEEFLQNTKSAFNKASADYDAHEYNNIILKWMRCIVQSVYLKYLKEGDDVLELNAGTGIDAVFLAQRSINVYATDISNEMVTIIKGKVKTNGLEGKISAETVSFNQISDVKSNNFKAVLSNFGGLNCVNNFTKLNTDLSAKLNSGGYFIAVVMNKFCPWEILFYSLKLDFKNAFRRFKKAGVDAILNGEKVRTYYYSPSEFGRFFKENFRTEKIYTLGHFTPPPYLDGVYYKLKPVSSLFMKLDNTFKGIPFFNYFGDHFIIILKKK
jgi:ubiquinone/menaquinone biosynthesis C-methylase UbiE